MDFEEKIDKMASKVSKQKDGLATEEATKNALIMPFIASVLGYDVFDPDEVIPEFVADVGLKKGEKIDYALVLDGDVQILIECKKVGAPLTFENASQLYRYYACTKARIGVLTNGQVWNFYMDLDKKNCMDTKPFLVLDLLDIDRSTLPALQKLTKPSFDLDSIESSAEEMRYLGSLRRIVSEEFKNPSNDLVRLFAGKVYDGVLRQNVLDRFKPLVEKSIRRFLSDQVNERLESALDAEESEEPTDESALPSDESSDEELPGGIVTTEEEIYGYQIVKAIACAEAAPDRITMRDAKSYCAIFLDDNNRKPIIRLCFNGKQKSLILFKDGKEHEKAFIDNVEGIYFYADQIRDEVKYLIANS